MGFYFLFPSVLPGSSLDNHHHHYQYHHHHHHHLHHHYRHLVTNTTTVITITIVITTTINFIVITITITIIVTNIIIFPSNPEFLCPWDLQIFIKQKTLLEVSEMWNLESKSVNTKVSVLSPGSATDYL